MWKFIEAGEIGTAYAEEGWVCCASPKRSSASSNYSARRCMAWSERGRDGQMQTVDLLIETEPHDLLLFFFLACRFLNSVGRSCFKGSTQNSKRVLLKRVCVCVCVCVYVHS